MIFHVYVTRDRQLGNYRRPVFDVIEPKFYPEEFARMIRNEPRAAEKFFLYMDSELYYLGTFDDSSCTFDFKEKPEYLDDLGRYFRIVGGQNDVRRERKEDEHQG